MHNWPTIPLGGLRVKAGSLMAHVSDFSLTIRGKGGHGSQPQLCVDPILAAAHVVTALQSVVSRSLSYNDSAVVSVCQFNGGEANNVIPDSVVLKGTIRESVPRCLSSTCRNWQPLVSISHIYLLSA